MREDVLSHPEDVPQAALGWAVRGIGHLLISLFSVPKVGGSSSAPEHPKTSLHTPLGTAALVCISQLLRQHQPSATEGTPFTLPSWQEPPLGLHVQPKCAGGLNTNGTTVRCS